MLAGMALTLISGLSVLSQVNFFVCGADPRDHSGQSISEDEFDLHIFCRAISTESSAKYCSDRTFAERGDVTKDTVSMVAVQEAQVSAEKACKLAFEHSSVEKGERFLHFPDTATKARAKDASDVTAQRLCEQMS